MSAWRVLRYGGRALDAVVRGGNAAELVNQHGVGYDRSLDNAVARMRWAGFRWPPERS